ncbi:hypothetical protein PSH58_03765 [Pseudomonas hefeiensis]|uniref:YkgJ family cysteine cluster protein n=1 Tax=Pseudomonas hefeiensis TaxID=2738125 RepID=A0ABY9GJR3_9PSED|nr:MULTISPECIES: hypothetical protein [unclassified Pseudomonas]WLH15403.1 hypothetical protein PSH57_03770 [Pseudomonas sp. FP205]WLH98454.1 hypothetical protein PSH58_03765 [Pseudomonas sp. FP53]WLI42719.1 hypothetical protein PSH74_03770 [Pseudomonas sp. FP821]
MCRHYNDADKHCLIYATRPDICQGNGRA